MSSQPSNNHIDQAIDALISDFQEKGEPDATPVTPPVALPPPVNPPPKSPKPSSKMEMAKLGDADAITAILNQLLQSQGISAKATLKTDILSVVLQGNKAPDQENCVAYLRKFVDQLDLVFLNKLLITGRRQGATFAAWTQEIDLNKSDDQSQSLFESVTSGIAGFGGTVAGNVSQAGQTINQTVSGQQDFSGFQGVQDQITEKMMEVFDFVVEERKRYYAANPHKVPYPPNVAGIIQSYANKNAAIAGAANIIPGPFGLAAAVPEIVATLRNQITMIYDIGVAHGKEQVLDKELLAGTFAYTLGQRGVGLIAIQGSKIVVRRASAGVFKKILPRIARPFAQRIFGSLTGKFLPIVGVIAMVAWAKHSTREIGKKAVTIFKQDIEYSSETINDIPTEVEGATVDPSVSTGISDTVKVQALINLMKIDGKIESAERQYLNTFIQNIEVSEKDKVDLLMAVDSPSKFSIDYSQFTQSPDDAIALLIDMIALSQHDGEFHVAEKVYIKQVGKQMGLSESDIEEMLVS